MAADKLVDSTQLDTDLTSVANAIRTKGELMPDEEREDDFSEIAKILLGESE